MFNRVIVIFTILQKYVMVIIIERIQVTLWAPNAAVTAAFNSLE